MQPNRSTLQKVAELVIIAGVFQAMSGWMLRNGSTFRPKGAGTQAITGIFGPNAFPALIAIKLDYAVRGMLLLALGVLTFGSLKPEPTRRYRIREYSRRWIDQQQEFE